MEDTVELPVSFARAALAEESTAPSQSFSAFAGSSLPEPLEQPVVMSVSTTAIKRLHALRGDGENVETALYPMWISTLRVLSALQRIRMADVRTA